MSLVSFAEKNIKKLNNNNNKKKRKQKQNFDTVTQKKDTHTEHIICGLFTFARHLWINYHCWTYNLEDK
mgnify:CR=1 FL=1